MKSLPIPDIDQIRAMLNGSIYDLLCNYVENPPRYDFRKCLTINRQKLVDYLRRNPGDAEAYFQKQKQARTTHDVERMWEEDGEYIVATMDHGNARDVRRFKSLAEAVAEHLLVSFGMY
jgi:hypothetical protein